jgi:hypothetical protein
MCGLVWMQQADAEIKGRENVARKIEGRGQQPSAADEERGEGGREGGQNG